MNPPVRHEHGLFAIELVGGRLDGYREGVRDLAPSRWYPSRLPRRAAFVAVGAEQPPDVEYRRTERVLPDGSLVYRFVPPTEAPGGRP